MDIYEYFNSRDVAEHCKKLGHSFTGREMAYLIWQSNHHTLHHKIAAWEELILTMPDEEHKDFEYAGGHGLHHFLRIYIDRLLKFLADFQHNSGDYLYSYEKLYPDSPYRCQDGDSLFTSYDRCIATAVTDIADSNESVSFRVRKRRLDDPASKIEDDPFLYLTAHAEPMDLIVAPYRGEEDLLVTPFGFYGMFIDIPTPFKSGDIVTSINLWGARTEPMVVDNLPDRQGEDYIDMCAKLWDLDYYKRLVCNDDCCYLSLEYYHGELKKHNRFLFALRNYNQRALPLEELLRSYAIVLLEYFRENRVGLFGWEEGMQELAGLDKETILTP